MKRQSIIAGLFILLMSVLLIPNFAYAEDVDIKYYLNIISDSEYYKPGDKVVIELGVSNVNSNVDATSVALEYDSSILTTDVSNVVDSDNSDYMNTADAQEPDTQGRIAYAILSGGVRNEGIFSTVTFTVKEATDSSTKIVLRVNPAKDKKYNNLVAVGDSKTIKFAKPLDSISLSSDKTSIGISEKTTLIPKYSPVDTTDNKDLVWYSDNENIAVVDSNGVVTGVGVGDCLVYAVSKENSDIKASYKITVTAELTKISLDKTNIELTKGKSDTLNVSYDPENYTTSNVFINWSSSDDSIVTVENGKISAVSYGTAKITAVAYSNGEVLTGVSPVSCEVNVTNHVKGIKINSKNVKLNRNTSYELVATLLTEVDGDDTTDDGKIVWESNSDVVDVSDGIISAVKNGTAKITAKFGEYSVTSNVVVVSPLENITIGQDFSILPGEVKSINVIPEPIDTTDDYKVSFNSSNKLVATVDENGNVRGIAPGETTITVSVDGTSITSSIIVRVSKVNSSSIEIDSNDNIEMNVDTNKKLTATIKPENTTDNKVIWSTSDESIASIDENGVVNAISSGKVVITAKNGEVSDSIVINVVVPVEKIYTSKDSYVVIKGTAAIVDYTIDPFEATNKTLTVVSSNNDVCYATIDEFGNVFIYGIGAGYANVTLKAGNVTKVIPVKVWSRLIGIEADDLELSVEDTGRVNIRYFDEDTNDSKEVIYLVDDESIVSVDEDGNFTGLKEGSTTVKIVSVVENVEPVTITVTVNEKKEEIIDEPIDVVEDNNDTDNTKNTDSNNSTTTLEKTSGVVTGDNIYCSIVLLFISLFSISISYLYLKKIN